MEAFDKLFLMYNEAVNSSLHIVNVLSIDYGCRLQRLLESNKSWLVDGSEILMKRKRSCW